MEEFQRKHVTENLPQLIEATSCSPLFLSKLRAVGVLHIADLSVLEKNSLDKFEQAKKLYEILETRKNGFELLKQALFETEQSGAYSILNKLSSKAATVVESYKRFGSISYNRNIVLGIGCNNTKVFQGKVANRDVAVKQISCEGVDMKQALEEATLLVKLDFHENIIRYINAEVTDDFILIALELCLMNLDTWVRTKSIPMEPVEILRQSAVGISHLHQMGIMHRDLKPANILIAELPTGEFRIKITDFGMSRKLQDERTSFTLHSNTFGTVGWIAPEVVEILEHTPASEAIIKMSYASDVFSLGCIFYFVLTDGIHPFGNPMRRETNIIDDKYSLKLSDLKCKENGCLSLIQYMIKHDPKDRPPISAILSHYFFWSPNTTLEYFSDVSTLISKNINDVSQCLVRLNHTHYSNWLAKDIICLRVKKFLQEKRNPGTDVRDLLETVGYLDSYYDTLPKAVKMALGPLPDEFIHYWLVRFQRLLPSTWEHFQDLKHHRILKKYYCETFSFREPEVENKNLSTDPIIVEENDESSMSPLATLKLFKSVPNLTRLVSLGDDKVQPEYVKDQVKEWETVLSSTDFRTPSRRSLSIPSISVYNRIETYVEAVHAIRNYKKDILTMEELREQNALIYIVGSGTLAGIHEHCKNYNDDKKGKHVKDITRLGTALHAAVIRGHLPVMEYLLNHQDFRTKIIGNKSAERSTGLGNFDRLLETCIANTYGQPTLHVAEKKKIVSTLVDINKSLLTDTSTSPLFAKHAHVDLLILLINLGAKSLTKDGSTVLHHACKYINPDEFNKLLFEILKHGHCQILSAKSSSGLTPIEFAVENFEPNVTTIELLKRDSDFQFGDIGSRLLLRAIKKNRSTAFLTALLKAGASWKYMDDREASLLHLCVETGNSSFLQYFLSLKKADVNTVDKFGNTALHYVFSESNKNMLQMTKLLVEAGINVNAKVHITGHTAFGLAVFMRHDEPERTDILHCLVSHGADLDVIDKKGNTLIHNAISYFYGSQWIDSLIGWGASIKALSKKNRTVIHIAVLVRNTAILPYLFDAGVDVNAKDSDGCTALHLLFSDTNPITAYRVFPIEETYNILKLFEKNKRVDWTLETNNGYHLWNLASKFRYLLGEQATKLIKSKMV